MAVTSLEFLLFLLVASAVFPLLRGVRTRQIALMLCNAGVLYEVLPNVASWAALLLFVCSGYAAGVTLRRWPSRLLFSLYLLGLLVAFVVLKKYGFLHPLFGGRFTSHPVIIVGLSYMLFRQIHFVVDAMQGQIERLSLWDYMNYQTNLFALLAGPIQRYQEFSTSWNSLRTIPECRHDLLKTYLRIFGGIIKMAGIAAVFFFVYSKCFDRLVQMNRPGAAAPAISAIVMFVAVLYLYPLYMYFNFSGYCDIMIAGGALAGLRLPENFDRPYVSRNILDFWTRWHRTLGFWIRDYLFMPMYKSIAERDPKRAPSLAFACYLLAFILAGVWHGTTSNFLIFGILHGVGASGAKLWEMSLVKRRGRSCLKQYLQSRAVRAVAVFATFNYVCLTMLFFPDTLARCLIPFRVLSSAIWARVHG